MIYTFKNREEAGSLLVDEILTKYNGNLENPVVVAIPRGGVVVAEPIAETLKAPLEIIIPRKLGAPFNEEFAIGAITEDGDILLNEDLTKGDMERLGITDEYIYQKAREELKKIEERKRKFIGNRERANLTGRDVIIVDDGVATGLTMKAAILSIRKEAPNSIILAVPVIPFDRVDEFQNLVDDLIALQTPKNFYAVGQFYEDFHQISDEEVIQILKNLEKDKAKE